MITVEEFASILTVERPSGLVDMSCHGCHRRGTARAVRVTSRRSRRIPRSTETALYPEAEYTFKHPLTQEVAYGSQLGERRKRVHAAVAQAIETTSAEKLDEHAALLAHHWERAGEALAAATWHARVL